MVAQSYQEKYSVQEEKLEKMLNVVQNAKTMYQNKSGLGFYDLEPPVVYSAMVEPRCDLSTKLEIDESTDMCKIVRDETPEMEKVPEKVEEPVKPKVVKNKSSKLKSKIVFVKSTTSSDEYTTCPSDGSSDKPVQTNKPASKSTKRTSPTTATKKTNVCQQNVHNKSCCASSSSINCEQTQSKVKLDKKIRNNASNQFLTRK